MDPSLVHLRRHAARAAGATAATLLLGGAWLAAWGKVAWAAWFLLAAPVSVYFHLFLWSRLRRNRPRENAPLIPALGYGTWLSLARGTLLALAVGFLWEPVPPQDPGELSWAPAVLFTLAVLSDYFDGYLARVEGKATLLGADFDMELDALGMLVGVSLAIHRGTLSYAFAPIGLARYAFVLGMWALRRFKRPIYDLPPSSFRRPVAGLTMGFLSVMLWPVVKPPGSTLAGAIFLIPFLASFLRDWLVVSGVIDPASERYRRIRDAGKTVLTRWVPLPLRLALLGALLLMWLQQSPVSPGRVAELNLHSPQTDGSALLALEAAGLTLIVLGVAGRVGSLVLLVPLSLKILAGGLTPLRATALVAAIGLLYLGTGIASLWQPEEKLFARRAGERGEG